jgi:hypothetical protein
MFSVILYMLRQTVDNRAPTLPCPSFSPLTVTFPKLSVTLRRLYTALYQNTHVIVPPLLRRRRTASATAADTSETTEHCYEHVGTAAGLCPALRLGG